MSATFELVPALQGLGVPYSQAAQLQDHITTAGQHVYPTDPGVEAGLADWMLPAMADHITNPVHAELLQGIVTANLPGDRVEYAEEGYDSCQAHRTLAKVVSEALLVGGIAHESALLGVPLSLGEAQALIGSTLDLAVGDPVGVKDLLVEIAALHGGAQDFLFPGVTPSSETVPSLGELAYLALTGNPATSVRTLTGVGGLRHDKGWNYAMDLPSFVGEKMVEDKRYYPGMGIFYLLMTQGLDRFPAVAKLKATQPDIYASLAKLTTAIKQTKAETFTGVSVLCSAYLPQWSELKTMQGFTVDGYLELAESFHSPSYEFATLKHLFAQLAQGEKVGSDAKAQLAALAQKLSHAWSFNSTIHLPWTAQMADLSNGMIGKITNQVGDHGVRYGVGHGGKSLEVREYSLGLSRTVPAGLAGKHAYEVRVYPGSDHFAGEYRSFVLHPTHPLWQATVEHGFIKAALQYLGGVDHA